MANLMCAQITELLPEYVLGALPPAEASDVQAHVAWCTDCRAALADYEAVTDGLLYAVPQVTAPARLEADLRRRIRPADVAIKPPARLGWRERWAGLFQPPWRYVTIVAMAAVVLLVVTNVYWLGALNQLQAQQASLAQRVEAQQLALNLLAAGGRSVALQGDAPNLQVTGAFVYAPDQHEAVLMVEGLPRLPPDRTYQLWLTYEDRRDSGGLFTVDAQGQGTLIVRVSGPLKNYDGCGVTVEPLGGSATPTTPRVIGGKL